MNDLQKLAKIMLVGIALYILINSAIQIVGSLAFLISSKTDVYHTIEGMLAGYVFLAVAAATVIYFLIYRSEWLAKKIVGRADQQQQNLWWVPVAFRLVCVFVGIYVMSWFLPQLGRTITYFLTARQPGYTASPYLHIWTNLLQCVVLGVPGLYLLFGAPHFVRWQVKKTIQQCKKLSPD